MSQFVRSNLDQCPMTLRVSSIDLTSREAMHKFMSLDCNLTVLRRTCFAGRSPLMSRSNSVDAIAWSFRRPVYGTPDGWVSIPDKLAKALFQPSHTLLVGDTFVSVMSWTFQSSLEVIDAS